MCQPKPGWRERGGGGRRWRRGVSVRATRGPPAPTPAERAACRHRCCPDELVGVQEGAQVPGGGQPVEREQEQRGRVGGGSTPAAGLTGCALSPSSHLRGTSSPRTLHAKKPWAALACGVAVPATPFSGWRPVLLGALGGTREGVTHQRGRGGCGGRGADNVPPGRMTGGGHASAPAVLSQGCPDRGPTRAPSSSTSLLPHSPPCMPAGLLPGWVCCWYYNR